MKNTAVAVDTGPLVALFDHSDMDHERALRFVSQAHGGLFTTMAAVTEAMYLLRFSRRAQRSLIDWVCNSGIVIQELENEDFLRINELMDKYGDLPRDFSDAVLVAVCEQVESQQIATIDRDFDIYRFKGRSKFKNLF